jgi:hypothetical protein
MARKPDEEETPKEWTPDKPLEDEDDENDVQLTFKKRERLKHLEAEAEAKLKKGGKGGKRSGSNWLS